MGKAVKAGSVAWLSLQCHGMQASYSQGCYKSCQAAHSAKSCHSSLRRELMGKTVKADPVAQLLLQCHSIKFHAVKAAAKVTHAIQSYQVFMLGLECACLGRHVSIVDHSGHSIL